MAHAVQPSQAHSRHIRSKLRFFCDADGRHRSAEFTTWRRLALIFGVWTLVAIMSTQASAFAVTRSGRTFDWTPVFCSQLPELPVWAAVHAVPARARSPVSGSSAVCGR
jgi:hypothetical protein